MISEDKLPCCYLSTRQSPRVDTGPGREDPHLWHPVHPQKGNMGEGTDTQVRGTPRGRLVYKGIFINRRAAALENNFPTGSESSFLEVWKSCQQDPCQSPLRLSLFIPWGQETRGGCLF